MVQQLAHHPVQEVKFAMAYDEYLVWADSHPFSEWVDGEVTVFAMPSSYHQRLAGFLFRLMAHLAETRDLGTVFFAPLRMLIRDGRSAREPDLWFVARDHAARISAKRVEGPADLVVEIISEESVTRDRQEKYQEYETVGIPEYWLFDARDGRRGVIAYRLGPDGRYAPIVPGPDGSLRSSVLPGFFFHPDWLGPEEPPTLASVLVGGI